MLANKLMGGAGAGEDTLYVDAVFSTYLYTGNGSTQTINNGIDLAGKGGLVWFANRGASSLYTHEVIDTARGRSNYLFTYSISAQGAPSSAGYDLTSFDATGFTLGIPSQINLNMNGSSFVSWTFRKAPKFFDVVTYTGDGVNGRAIAHNLGATPGCIIIKRTDNTGTWRIWHRSLAAAFKNSLNFDLLAASPYNAIASTNSTNFVVTNSGPTADLYTNINGATYVAYLFAHDPSEEGIIQCGSYVGNGSTTGPVVNLGWEPQYLMIKNASGAGDWQIIDNMRGMPVGSADATLQANLDNAEAAIDYVSPTATGFQITSTISEVNTSAATYIYLAIRRPNKPPTSGSQVYNSIARTGTGAAATVTGVGFAPDTVLATQRSSLVTAVSYDKLRGGVSGLVTRDIAAEGTVVQVIYSNDGFAVGSSYPNNSGQSFINWCFKRAPGFFDIVCYTGTSSAMQIPVSGSFGAVKPELVIYKSRSAARDWIVWPGVITNANNYLIFNSSSAISSDSTVFPGGLDIGYIRVGANALVNNAGEKYVAYLFASLPGIQYIDSYVGDGTSGRVINCGFSSGARFICIKAASTTGSWWIFDSTRGVLAAADPALQLNSTAAEITSADAIDPHVSGFIINQEATCSINASGVSYLVWAIA